MVPFGLFWGGFAIFWEYSAITSNKTPLFFVFWGIPFVLIGIYLIVGRFFIDSQLRSHTYYGVTDQRVLVLSGVWAREVMSVSLQNLYGITLRERSDGSGDILFGSMYPMSEMERHTAWSAAAKKRVPTFEFICDVRKVYDLIQQAKRKK